MRWKYIPAKQEVDAGVLERWRAVQDLKRRLAAPGDPPGVRTVTLEDQGIPRTFFTWSELMLLAAE